MPTSIIYCNSFIYELVIRGLYGRNYAARYRTLAGLIPDGASVLDLCCGPGALYRRWLKARGIRYLGIDINRRFIESLIRGGAAGEVRDLREDRPLPRADYVLMQASLYHFLPDPRAIIDRMMAAAGRQVIIAEPIRNWADSRVSFISRVARRASNAGQGTESRRFNEKTFDDFFAGYGAQVKNVCNIPGGRERIVVLEPQ